MNTVISMVASAAISKSQQTSTDENDFSSRFEELFQIRKDKVDIDLANATLVDVLIHHEAYKQQKYPKYSHSSVITLIREIEGMIKNGKRIMPRQVNSSFYDTLEDYMYNVKGLKPGTMTNYFGQISLSLRWAERYGTPISRECDEFSIKATVDKKEALTLEEVIYIYNFDFRSLTKTTTETVRELREVIVECKRNGKTYLRRIKKYVEVEVEKVVQMFKDEHIITLEHVRDMFVLSCNFGQRFSDMSRVSPEYFTADKQIFSIIQQKTGERAVVEIKSICPSPRITFAILEKYNHTAPYKGKINTYNKHLHEIGALLGSTFNDQVIYEDKQYGEIVRTILLKKDCLTSHCARRTFVTINARAGKNEFEIRRATGHKRGSDAFDRYVNL